jgi:RNA recognition motif-containing protein
MVKLFLGGFPLEITEMELVQLLSPHGEVCTIKIVRDRKTCICKGYTFVEMTSEKDARNIIAALHGEPIGHRTFSINFADEKKNEKQPNELSNRYNKDKLNELSEPRTKRPRKRL